MAEPTDVYPDWPFPDHADPPTLHNCPAHDPEPKWPTFADGTQLKKWTLDLCNLALCAFAIRPEEHSGAPCGDWDNPETGTEAGFPALCTIHGVRAKDGRWDNHIETCRRHYGRVYVDGNGDWRGAMFTDHQGWTELHECLAFVADDEAGEKTNDLVEPGDWAMVTALAAPEWTEAILVTHQRICQGENF